MTLHEGHGGERKEEPILHPVLTQLSGDVSNAIKNSTLPPNFTLGLSSKFSRDLLETIVLVTHDYAKTRKALGLIEGKAFTELPLQAQLDHIYKFAELEAEGEEGYRLTEKLLEQLYGKYQSAPQKDNKSQEAWANFVEVYHIFSATTLGFGGITEKPQGYFPGPSEKTSILLPHYSLEPIEKKQFITDRDGPTARDISLR